MLYIYINDEDTLKRLAVRRVCEDCGENIPWLPQTKHLTQCPKCGGRLIAREDDNINTIRQRIKKQGNMALAPIISFYSHLGVVTTINGEQTIEEVWRDVEKAIK